MSTTNSELVTKKKVRREGFVPECGYSRLKELILAFRAAGACNYGVSYEDVAKFLGKDETWVSRNAKFLMKIGFLIREKQKSYKLTKRGCEYAKQLELGLEEEAREILRETLLAYDLTKWTCNLVRIKKSISRDELIRRIAAQIDVPLKIHRFKSGINAFIDMLMDIGVLISHKDGTIGLAETMKPHEQSEQLITAKCRYPKKAISTEDEELTEIRFRHIRIVLKPNPEDIEIAKKLLKTLEDLVAGTKEKKEERRKEGGRKKGIPPLMNFTEGGRS